MAALDLQEFVDQIGRCTTEDQLFERYRSDIENEGFQNISFARLGGPQFFEAPFIHVPDGAASVYFNENFAEHDPVFAALPTSANPFTWASVNDSPGLSAPAVTVVETCRDLGLHSGFAIPVHGPGGRCDLFSLSLRDKRTIDPARMTIITMKTYATWMRYNEIDCAARLQLQAAGSDCAGGHAHHHDGLARITSEECRALVVADIAHRRYRAGLTELNDKLLDVLGKVMFERLRDRGLLADLPDDARWRYFASPTPLARAHLRTCPSVAPVRDTVWQLYVRADERPADWS